jgi:ketosteroid isomerase-like protein
MGAVEERNKALARQFLEVLTRSDVAAADALCDDEVEFWVGGSLPFSGSRGKAEALQGIEEVVGLFPEGLHFEVQAMTAEGDRVAIEATGEGPTAFGTVYRQEYHFALRVRDGKVLAWKEYLDTERAREHLVVEPE